MIWRVHWGGYVCREGKGLYVRGCGVERVTGGRGVNVGDRQLDLKGLGVN